MRHGFFYGIGGDLGALERVLARLRDCDRIVSLGDLLGGAEDREVWERFEALGARGIALSGPAERSRARDRSLPVDVRIRLRDLPSSTVEDGIAILGAPVATGRRESAATGGAPRLVAPLTVTAHPGETRLWRSAGGLARVSEPRPDEELPSRGERLWIELGRTAAGKPTCAVVDPDRGVVVLRDPTSREPAFVATDAPRPRSRRRRMVDERQCLLAV